ncbi:MtrAB system histidine kinase MtrB [Actinocrinis sp.]|uniref:MtrAB system histidine kinase MtrB n=1 Tax=Actinocrinis sp. TaxID=1920516 RepID=UPI002D57DEED|nr:MtrAB system histidine kinase MtrB [Actinocrinis sp.]HZP50392.1 MtrAB system histidine kinase MtrB [Actinocrinis sp.]
MGARLRRALRAASHALRDLPARWRRSLQFRVVSVTMVLSLAVAVGLGYFIAQRVADGILRTRLDAAKEQASVGFQSAVQDFNSKSLDPTIDTGVLATNVVRSLCKSSTLFQVAVVLQKDADTAAFPAACANLTNNTIPADLQTKIANVPAGQGWYEFATVQYRQNTKADAVVVGQRVTANNSGTEFTADIFYVFPLSQDEANLHTVELSLVLAGLLLVLALVAIAWFVSRQVVTPVRMAAGIAERLAAGRLEERMRVRGEDDLASLANSFNKMAANLQNQIRRLEELSRVQRRFVSDVSHELRTPLTTVRMAADLIHEARETFDPVVSRSAELLQNQLDRFEELLADLLEISRFDAGAAILDAEPVDLRALVQRVVDSSAPLADRKGSTVIVEAPEEPCVAEVDARRIDRVLRNLVVNAIEHGEGRDVIIKVAASDDAVAVAVRDHGVGLRPGESSLVFNRFWRADPARARTTGGTGLGLAIALEDARLHHGWLQAWGEPGGGSQFRLTVPRNTRVELLRSPIPLEPEDSSHHLRQRRGSTTTPVQPQSQTAPQSQPQGSGHRTMLDQSATSSRPGAVRAPAGPPGSPKAASKPGQDTAAVVDRATVSSPPSITGFGEGDLRGDVNGGDGNGTGDQA